MVAKLVTYVLSVGEDVGQEPFMKKTDWMFRAIFVNMKNWHILTAFSNYMSFKAEQYFLTMEIAIFRLGFLPTVAGWRNATLPWG